jgi:hypothetical protein
MNLRLAFLIVVVLGIAQGGLAQNSLLHESLTIQTRPGNEVRGAPEFPPLPSRTGVGFGSAGRSSVSSAGQPGKGAATGKRRFPVCGPSAAINTMVCYGLDTGSLLGEFPIPGALSTTPVFFEESWLFGTSEGFLVRTNRVIGGQVNPFFENSRLPAFWGAEARKEMAAMRKNSIPAEYKWAFYTSAEFTGTPIVVNNVVLALASNQFLYALDWNTGRVLWTLRLAPDASMRLLGDSLALLPGRKEGEVAVGTSEGLFLGVSVANGQVQWRHRMPTAPGERFHAAMAKAKPLDRSLLLTSAEGVIQKVAVERCHSEGSDGSGRCAGDSRFVEWSYSIGTTFTPVVSGNRVLVGGEDGSVVMLDGGRSGALMWRKPLFHLPVVAMTSLPAQSPEYVLVVSASGEVVLLDFSGKVRGVIAPLGVPVGEFIAGRSGDEACLSFSIPGLRCFSIAY